MFGICEPAHNMFLSAEESFRNWLIRICRYHPGDILYVRETWNSDWCDHAIYRADGGSAKSAGYTKEPKWRPSIHMPKEAARIFLRVTGVRVERLMDITESGAMAEGFSKIEGFQPATKAFFDVWRAIYGDSVTW